MQPTPLDLDQLIQALLRPRALLELAALASLLFSVWLLVWLLGRRAARAGSIWLGEHIVDGLLFPALALALVYTVQQLTHAWGLTSVVFKLAVPVLMSLAVIRLSVRVLSAAFPTSRLMRVAERTISWMAWGAVVMWVTGVLPVLMAEMEQIQWKIGAHPVSLRTLLEGSLSAGFVLVIALWISAALESRLLEGAAGGQLSLRKAAANAVRALLMFVGLLLALSAVGIDLTALGVLGGALGVGIGFGLQKLAANYISGFVILAERSMRIGDLVKVGDFEGRITDITTRYTVIRAGSGREAIVPNETLITTTVQNLSLADCRLLLQTTVSIAYGSDVAALRPAILAVVAAVPRVLSEPAPAVHLSALGPHGLELNVQFWIGDPEVGQLPVVSDVNAAVLGVLESHQVELGLGTGTTKRFAPPPAPAPTTTGVQE